MYVKYTLFYESPKNWGYLRACANSVYQAFPRGEGPGNEAREGDLHATKVCYTNSYILSAREISKLQSYVYANTCSYILSARKEQSPLPTHLTS